MPYPPHTPSSKHDLIRPFTSGTTLSPRFTSAEEILQVLEDRRTNNRGSQNQRPEKISAVYGYKDDRCAPKDRPPSKVLEILGYFSFKRFLPSLACDSYSFDDDKPPGKGVSSFHIGVKRLDDERVREQLMNGRPKEVDNSERLASFCEALRNDDGGDGQLCAILNYDKYERIMLVKAMNREEDGSNYAAHCFMTKLNELKTLLSHDTDTNTSNGHDNAAGSDMNDMTTEEPSSFGDNAGGGDDAGLWQPPDTASELIDTNAGGGGDAGLWQPPDTASESIDTGNDNLWQPHGGDDETNTDTWNNNESDFPTDFNTANDNDNVGGFNDGGDGDGADGDNEEFHTDTGAAAADEFYSNLTRSLGTRADSMIYHMRNYNGWVKATQIAELNPKTDTTDDPSPAKKKRKKQGRKNLPLRVLDLACGKGGDLGKWALHSRKIRNYVGIDVARGSLVDAAIRARKMGKKMGGRCVFTCADLGSDVPGRPRTRRAEAGGRMQKLLSWSLDEERADEDGDPVFKRVEGGGVKPGDKFDVVSIQFAIHYMMQTRKRARRFFHTVSQLLDVGGNLVATTIDARVVLGHLMNTGFDLHFGDGGEKEKHQSIYNEKDNSDDTHLIVSVGEGACQLKFDRNIVKKMFNPNASGEELFGLEYTFTLVEGKDHAAGVGDAVNLPEWLIPLPVLNELAKEAGLTLEYAQNFHEFFMERRDPVVFHSAHNALYSMSVLNRDGRISEQEWDISRMYMAVRYRKDRESTMVLDEEDEEEEEEEDGGVEKKEIPGPAKPVASTTTTAPKKTSPKMFMMAMAKAKKSCTPEVWNSLTSAERTLKTNAELEKL